MDPVKVDLLIKYALARAAHEDVAWQRELGAIHLLKYVYLADVAYAERNEGKSFTGVAWKFFHYGPWAPAVMDRVTAVVNAIGAKETRFQSSRYENDVVRWFIPDHELAEQLQDEGERDLPTPIVSCLRTAVRKFGSDTSSLLHHVYATGPMVNARPNAFIDLKHARLPERLQKPDPRPPLTRKQEKKREEALRRIRESAQAKLKKLREERARAATARAPRYDDVFENGQRWLDSMGGGSVPQTQGELEFSDEVWTAPWRTEPGG